MNADRLSNETGSAFLSEGRVSEPFLRTKLFKPQPRMENIPRRRLIERLNEGTQGSLTLISAPAGFGKTTILAEWAAQSKIPVAWVSLDADDYSPRRFLTYLVTAINDLTNGVLDEELAMLGSSTPFTARSITARLLNRLEDLSDPMVVVLDDYHLISDMSLHEILAFVLDHLPPKIHIILATRSDPPIPLSRLRGRGELQELRSEDLRFRKEETALFLKHEMGFDLSTESIALLEERTEGWIVGLKLAALSMQGREDLSDFVQNFSGSNRFILDYFFEEIINKQPERVQRFLISTSILERLSGPLCDALVEDDADINVPQHGSNKREIETLSCNDAAPFSMHDSQSILDYLDRSNLFLSALDDKRYWFRYHHLFADLLRVRLKQAEPEAPARLHLKAAGWYEHNGSIAEAVRHCFAAGAYERAADLLEIYGHKHWSLNDTDFLSLVSKLPLRVLTARPSLGIYHAWLIFLSGQHEKARAVLLEIQKEISPDDHSNETKGIRSFINLLLLYIAEMNEDLVTEALPDRQAPAFVPEHHLGMRNSADVLYAYLLDQRGDFHASEEILLTTVQRDMAANGYTAVPICISRLARNRVLQGRLREAARLCKTYIRYVQERGEKRFYIAGNLYLVLSGIAREWNDLDEAERLINAGMQANEPWKLPQVDAVMHLAKARLQQARGEVADALGTLKQLKQRIEGKSITPDLLAELRSLQMRLWLDRGDPEKARAQIRIGEPKGVLAFRDELDHILLARIYLYEGKVTNALSLLERLAEQAEAGGRQGRLLEIWLLEALALAKNKQLSRAFAKIGLCLTLAEPERFLRIFLDEGGAMKELLTEYLSDSTREHTSYARRILGEFEPRQPGSTSPAAMIEPLTQREMEVLELIAAGESNQDIAEKLVIALSTVKKHTGSIYGKLDVTSRTQAVARARQLNILPPEV